MGKSGDTGLGGCREPDTRGFWETALHGQLLLQPLRVPLEQHQSKVTQRGARGQSRGTWGGVGHVQQRGHCPAQATGCVPEGGGLSVQPWLVLILPPVLGRDMHPPPPPRGAARGRGGSSYLYIPLARP